jgi:hypothetical protein
MATSILSTARLNSQSEAKARYRASEKGRAKELAYSFEYESRPEVKERKRARAQTPEGKLSAKAASEKYAKSEKGKARRALYAKQYHPAKRYGVTADHRALLEEQQGGVCAICSLRPDSKELSVDHCHETGRVRGLLCHYCNLAIGLFRDRQELLLAAAAYLSTESSK